MDLRQTDEWMVADAGGVGGEAWTCDRQTNGINFI